MKSVWPQISRREPTSLEARGPLHQPVFPNSSACGCDWPSPGTFRALSSSVSLLHRARGAIIFNFVNFFLSSECSYMGPSYCMLFLYCSQLTCKLPFAPCTNPLPLSSLLSDC